MQTPTKAGQICRITNPLEDENPEEVYIMSEDPGPFAPEDTVYVVGLKDLQRNVRQPELAEQIAVAKNELFVVADTLEIYISSWNQPV